MAKRDYRAEYQARIARASVKGYSRAIARGHAPKGVIGIKLAEKIGVPVGTDIEDITIRTVNAQGEDPRLIRKALIDDGFTAGALRGIDFENQESFVRAMLGYGYTFREAFDFYFGYS